MNENTNNANPAAETTQSAEVEAFLALGQIFNDLRRRLGRIEKHLIDLKGGKAQREPRA